MWILKVKDKFIVDPKYETSINELKNFKPNFIFICVPTPMKNDGSQDTSIVIDVFSKLKNNFKGVPKILKSTILPDTLLKLANEHDSLIYNPEFLREKNADKDFINAPFIILGGRILLPRKLKNYIENIQHARLIIIYLLTSKQHHWSNIL